ncbi:hydroxyacid dehydrogenase [Streptomyces sp. NPDC058221]|uniref:hydroxyacid dehydrogenase n=1 Tax=Streptomyces sp. NPDC058221 TaxID=3346388 RepID=UPI0036E68548
MITPTVVVADPLPDRVLAGLGSRFTVRRCDGTDRAALLAAVADAEALIVRSATRVDRAVLAAAPRLRIVARAGVGLDNVDVEAAAEAGVLVANAPESNVVSVAELTVGLIISALRHIPAAAASVRAGQWRRADFQGTELYGRTVGILGFGRVGRLVAKRLAAFEMKIEYYDPYVPQEAAAPWGARAVGLGELLRGADVLTVHLPLTAETRELIGENELRLAKRDLLLVNTARGGIVDEEAVARALAEGRIAGACLDVFATEPSVPRDLLALPSLLPTPHIGAGTAQAQLRAGEDAVSAVREVLLPAARAVL